MTDAAELARSGTPSRPRQLALALDHAASFAREDFLAGPANQDAFAWIERWPDWPDRMLMLVGPKGSGKSHVAAIWAENAGARRVGARSIDRAGLPAAFATGSLVLEDLTAGGFDENALFHLINYAREERAFVLMTARTMPASWNVALPDLASRLRALTTIQLAAPDDAMLRAVIVKLFADRQLEVEAAVVAYLALRIERSFEAAARAVEELDREALRRQRPVTRALAGELFREP